MATRNGTTKKADRDEVSRIDRLEEEARSAAEQGDDIGLKFLLARREAARRIKLHDQQQRKARSKREAVVLTKDGLPDMRFAEDKVLFSPDPSRRVTDDEPDQRFLENRRDLQELHRRRGDTRKNFIFTDDMMPLE